MPIRIYGEPKIQNPYLLVGWSPDGGSLGSRVMDYLIKETGAEEFCELEPAGFFPLDRVDIDDDVIQFPDSRFFASESRNLVIFRSSQPQKKHLAFLGLVLDVAERLRASEICTVGGMISGIAHTSERKIVSVVTRPELKRQLAAPELATGMDYQGGPPTVNSLLLWLTQNRNFDGLSLWQEIPFYLAEMPDLRAVRTMLGFLDGRFGWHLDLTELDRQVASQEQQIDLLRQQHTEIGEYISRLERGDELTAEEGQRLASQVAESLGKGSEGIDD